MTDKQIVIDGVNVSGREFLDNVEYDKLCLMISHRNECQVNCSNKPNCYYKQLKRKEQECDKLKQALAEIKEIAEECYYKCNSMNNCNISCKYYNNCNGEFSYLLAYLNKQISEVENDNK